MSRSDRYPLSCAPEGRCGHSPRPPFQRRTLIRNKQMDDVIVAVWLFLLFCILAGTFSALIRHKQKISLNLHLSCPIPTTFQSKAALTFFFEFHHSNPKKVHMCATVLNERRL